jgi:putative transposase
MARLARLVIPGKVAPLLAMGGDWRALLDIAIREEEIRDLRRHGRTGRPLGDETLLGRLEEMVGRVLKPRKRGPKPNHRAN